VITAAGQSFLWRGFTFWHLSGVLEQIWQFQRGRTIDLGIWQFELGYLLHSGVAIVPGSYCIFVYCKRYCSTSYIHHISKLVFPGGVLSRVMLSAPQFSGTQKGLPIKKSLICFYQVAILGMVFSFGGFMAHSFVVYGNVILVKELWFNSNPWLMD
jgi:hypothetical protein